MTSIKISIFICSSDNTYDIFREISKSVVSGFNGDSFKFYVGLNKNIAPSPFVTIKSPVFGWREELAYQLKQLPLEVEYLVLMLDDFFVYERINKERFSYIFDFATKNKVDYLRLVPLKRSIIVRLFKFIYSKFTKHTIEKIQKNEPYYSSLQASIWRRKYLQELLNNKVSIWDFENLAKENSRHYAVSQSGIIKYEHLIEKGKWLRHARRLLPHCEYDLFLKRGWDNRMFNKYKIFREAKFHIYGYSVLKIKRFFQN